MALMAAATGHEGGLLLVLVAGFVPIASYRSFEEVLLVRCCAVGVRSGTFIGSETSYSFGVCILPRQSIERAIFLRSSGDIFMETLCTVPDHTALRRVPGSRTYIIRIHVKL